jgi:hypothetical protein
MREVAEAIARKTFELGDTLLTLEEYTDIILKILEEKLR